ncbi:hypothetical protein [Stenotrophomonas sp. SY1]|uniref:hypothetical protein n=1 Tax=Stenotrophomonas sp. SY1 TaxID=477235 RepID=UPI001E48817C|nr:hypothetical protein [Stenotrophomonas sp. SY1]MCD9087389.1 hypothetical protein [Stenotrophomonas sp. SY1]
MKNKVSDVRDHLVAMLENLGDDTASPEKMALTIERAKATSLVANTYIGAVKVELDAIELHHEVGRTTVAVEAPQNPALPGRRQ